MKSKLDKICTLQFFNNALMLGKMSESEVSDRLYDLIYELNTISPSVLLAVLPQLEFKLKVSICSKLRAIQSVNESFHKAVATIMGVDFMLACNAFVIPFVLSMEIQHKCI